MINKVYSVLIFVGDYVWISRHFFHQATNEPNLGQRWPTSGSIGGPRLEVDGGPTSFWPVAILTITLLNAT